MTNPAYEATNSDVEKLIAPYESKFPRLWERYDEACHANAEHMRDILGLTLNALEGAESDIAVLTSALGRSRAEREEFRNRLKLERSILEDADKRIAELDRKNCQLNSTMERWAVDRAESANRIAELEAAAVDPVTLPRKLTWSYHDNIQQGEALSWNNAIEACAEAIRAAGGTVAGGE